MLVFNFVIIFVILIVDIDGDGGRKSQLVAGGPRGSRRKQKLQHLENMNSKAPEMTKKPEELASLKNNTLNVQSLQNLNQQERNDDSTKTENSRPTALLNPQNTTAQHDKNEISTSTAATNTSQPKEEDKTKMKAKLEHMIANNKIMVFSKTSSPEA